MLEKQAALIIYNSRNYKCFIDMIYIGYGYKIYNSRNYKCFIDFGVSE